MKLFKKTLPAMLAWLLMMTCHTNLYADVDRPVGSWHIELPDNSSCEMVVEAESSNQNNPNRPGHVCDGYITLYDANFEIVRNYDIDAFEKGKFRITYQNEENGNEVKFIVYTYPQGENGLILASTDSESSKHPFVDKEFTRTNNGENQNATATEADETVETNTDEAAVNETDGTIEETSEAETEKEFSWSEFGKDVLNFLIGLAISGLFLWMVGHMIYILTRPKRFSHAITIEEMAERRRASGLPEEMTEEEYETANNYMATITDNWTCIGTRDGEDQFTPTTKPQVDSAYNLLDQTIALCPTDADIVARINEVGEYVNDRSKRSFDGSKIMLVVAGLFTAFFTYLVGWGATPFFLLSMGLYYLASLCPNYLIDKKQLKGRQRKTSNYIFGAIFGFMASAQTVRTVTTYSDGSKDVDDDHSQHIIFTILGTVALLIMVYFLAVWGAINYLRNYVFYK